LAADSQVYAKGVTMTFAGIVVAQAGNVLACRTSKQSIFRTSLKTNKWIIFGIISQIGILSLLIYVPVMQGIFTTTALNLSDWAFLLSLAVIVVFAEEIRKFFSRKFTKTSAEALKVHDHT
jgi:magnesium-transporting ATPase (P-type)